MIIAGIVAGGTGSRMGNTKLPKQFLDLCGKPVIVRTTEKFISVSQIDIVIIGINPEWKSYMTELKDKYFKNVKKLIITDGGEDRNATVQNIISAAKKLGADDESIVLTHDAVRPFVTEKMISDSVNAMKSCDICTVAIPATDTVVSSESGVNISGFPLRKTMFQEQTPQTFKLGTFKKVYENIDKEQLKNVTDVCRLFYMCGYDVKLIQGDVSNIKLTFPYDYTVAKILVENKKF